MAFPSDSGTRDVLAAALSRARAIARTVKGGAINLRDASAAGPITARRPVQYMEELTNYTTQFNALKTVPGLAAYARAQYDDANFDIAAEFGAMQSAMAAVVSWIATNIPKDSVSGRWILVEEIINGERVDRMLSSAATAQMRTVLDALIATID